MKRSDEMLTIRDANDPNPFWGHKYKTYKCKYAGKNEWCEQTVERSTTRKYFVCGTCREMKNKARANVVAIKVKLKKELHTLSTTDSGK